MTGGQGGHGPKFFEIVGFSEVLMLRQKIFRLLLLVKALVSNFIGKSSNIAPLLYRYHDAPFVIPEAGKKITTSKNGGVRKRLDKHN